MRIPDTCEYRYSIAEEMLMEEYMLLCVDLPIIPNFDTV